MPRFRKETLFAGVVITALAYVGSFFALKKGVLEQYERRLTASPHWLRPYYNVAYYPLRWLAANRWSLTPPSATVERGKIDTIEDSRVTLEKADGSFTSIGFTASVELKASLKNFSTGDPVEIGLGTALFENHDAFMNRLLFIHKTSR